MRTCKPTRRKGLFVGLTIVVDFTPLARFLTIARLMWWRRRFAVCVCACVCVIEVEECVCLGGGGRLIKAFKLLRK